MLTLKNITKDYVTGDTTVRALKGVSLDFRDNEFVSILGASGCGKTTMLNIVGGLDRYTEGDLVINGVSTKEFEDGDWDTYRNHTIGFVFQTYNLIMHQTVLGNVELALTLSGVSPAERKEKAKRALERVGLGDQINKKPNQLSGGQMQRVAIARAIVNDPDIILADEPTGALDTATSVQIMDILKEIANDRLVIMVTHNPELAESYSTRIVRLSDGELISDTNPVTEEEKEQLSEDYKKKQKEAYLKEHAVANDKKPSKSRKNKQKRPSMSFFTALSLSLRNLLTKKARTILVSFAGSIGIIGIALILSLSDGFQSYINKVQEDTLSSYPLTIESETRDVSSMVTAIMGVVTDTNENKEPGYVYANNMMHKMLASSMQETIKNDITTFKKSLESATAEGGELAETVTALKYTYDLDLNIYFEPSHPLYKGNGAPMQVVSGFSMGSMGGLSFGLNTWEEMLDNEKLLQSQYDLVGENSRWPNNWDEVVIVVDKNEEITDMMLLSLGLIPQQDLFELMQQLMNPDTKPEDIVLKEYKYSYDELLSLRYKLAIPTDFYNYSSGYDYDKNGPLVEKPLADVLATSHEIKVVGIVKPKVAAAATSITGTIGYTKALTDEVIRRINDADIVEDQLNLQPAYDASGNLVSAGTDIFTGNEFTHGTVNKTYTLEHVAKYLADELSSYGITEDHATAMVQALKDYYVTNGSTAEKAEEAVISHFKDYLEYEDGRVTYERNLRRLGWVDPEEPETISIYAVDFESKDAIVDWIDSYNKSAAEDSVISYTDYVGLMMSSVSTIINAISYVLIGFVSISLIVSSIMIGVITYISVLERIKEIGILRSIGASKRDISRVFNAETFIVGLVSGVFGVGIAMLLDIPINLILASLADLHNIAAVPWWGIIGLIVISVCLTLIAGLVPSRLAAKKDPVIALRSGD